MKEGIYDNRMQRTRIEKILLGFVMIQIHVNGFNDDIIVM